MVRDCHRNITGGCDTRLPASGTTSRTGITLKILFHAKLSRVYYRCWQDTCIFVGPPTPFFWLAFRKVMKILRVLGNLVLHCDDRETSCGSKKEVVGTNPEILLNHTTRGRGVIRRPTQNWRHKIIVARTTFVWHKIHFVLSKQHRSWPKVFPCNTRSMPPLPRAGQLHKTKRVNKMHWSTADRRQRSWRSMYHCLLALSREHADQPNTPAS